MTQRRVAILSAFQVGEGVLEGLWGLIFALSPGGMGTADSSAAMWIGLSLTGLAVACNGLLRVVAGLLTGALRARALGIATLVAGLLAAVTCLCLPTSFALCAYGLCVYFDKDVRRAFARRAAGASIAEVTAGWGKPDAELAAGGAPC